MWCGISSEPALAWSAAHGSAVDRPRCPRGHGGTREDQCAAAGGIADPARDKGIQPISRESDWNAVAYGKQGGDRPAGVFYETGHCKNGDFTLAFFTPSKMVACEVWQAVRRHQDAPIHDYAVAQQIHIAPDMMPVLGSRNPVSAGASAALALLDDIHRHRLRRAA